MEVVMVMLMTMGAAKQQLEDCGTAARWEKRKATIVKAAASSQNNDENTTNAARMTTSQQATHVFLSI